MNKIWLKVIDHAPLNYNWFGCGPHVNIERQLSDNHKGKWQVCDLFLGQLWSSRLIQLPLQAKQYVISRRTLTVKTKQ